jgi:hypothetical protein
MDTVIARANSLVAMGVADDASVPATNSWNAQQKAFQQWFGIDAKSVDWKDVQTLASARNTVAHGLGTLTRRQKPSRPKLLAAFRALMIDLIGDTLVLSDASLVAATSRCADLISHIDLEMQRRPSSYR